MCYNRAWKVVRNCRVRRQSVGEQAWSLSSVTMVRMVIRADACRSRLRVALLVLAKLQHILQTLRFPGIIVLVDRVDEPELVNGKPELMRMFDFGLCLITSYSSIRGWVSN